MHPGSKEKAEYARNASTEGTLHALARRITQIGMEAFDVFLNAWTAARRGVDDTTARAIYAELVEAIENRGVAGHRPSFKYEVVHASQRLRRVNIITSLDVDRITAAMFEATGQEAWRKDRTDEDHEAAEKIDNHTTTTELYTRARRRREDNASLVEQLARERNDAYVQQNGRVYEESARLAQLRNTLGRWQEKRSQTAHELRRASRQEDSEESRRQYSREVRQEMASAEQRHEYAARQVATYTQEIVRETRLNDASTDAYVLRHQQLDYAIEAASRRHLASHSAANAAMKAHFNARAMRSDLVRLSQQTSNGNVTIWEKSFYVTRTRFHTEQLSKAPSPRATARSC